MSFHPFQSLRAGFVFGLIIGGIYFVPSVAVGQQLGSSSESASSITQNSKLTPEERAERKKLKQQEEFEQAVARQKAFGSLPVGAESALCSEYTEAFKSFREAMANLETVRHELDVLRERSLETIKSKSDAWNIAIADGNQKLRQWLTVAGELYASDPIQFAAIGNSLEEMLIHDAELDRFEPWLSAAKSLVNNGGIESDETLVAAGLVGLVHSDFDFAEKCWSPMAARGTLPLMESRYLPELNELKVKWERELAIRQKEKEKDDNPRVEVITTKGRFVIELYEDSAPQAVNNFIYLVERGFYTRRSFFRVEKHLCAQTGCEKDDGTGNAGYTIVGEADLPERRDHFRGSLAVALGLSERTGQTEPNSGGSQCYFAFLPLPHLDGRHTVFGRILEGQETINLFRVLNLSDKEEKKDTSKNPDMIQSAKVIRKRDHEYRPEVFMGKLLP